MDSTNLEARRRIDAGWAHAFALVARVQTGGRGRLGRVWESPAGGLWLTVAAPHAHVNALTGLAAAQVCVLAIGDTAPGVEVEVKPPNDVLLQGRKVAGVLVESVSHAGTPWAIVGIGINANMRAADLSAPLRARSATLLDALGEPVDGVAIEARIIGAVCALLAGDRRHHPSR